MPKAKSHSGIAKRMKVTPKGTILRKHSGSNHFMQKKSAARKRTIGSLHSVTGEMKKNIKKACLYNY